MKRREFLKQTGLAAGALSVPSPVHAKAGPKRYDIIIVGAGAAGSIVAKRLVDRFPRKSILLLEAGGPTSVTVGGRDFPPYDPHATIFDVPGEYTNIAFQPKGDPYRQPETPFTYQGTGYGGNSQFNGMLFQAAPPFDFDEAWPRGWSYADIKPYFDRVLGEMKVSDVPSTDGLFYNAGASTIAADIYRSQGFSEANTSVLGGLGDRYFSRAYVVSQDGMRGGPVRSHLTSIVGPGGESIRRNLTLIPFAKVERIIFDATANNRAAGLTYATPDGVRFAALVRGGRIVLAGGALMTPRLLLLSGVGPFAKHDEIFSDGFSVPFHIDNPGVGTSLFDHVATALVYEYTGSVPSYRGYHYDDYAANQPDLARYSSARRDLPTFHGDVETASEYVSHIILAQTELGRDQTVNGLAIPDGSGVVAASSVLNTGTGFSYYPNVHLAATSWYLIAASAGHPYQL